MRITNAMMNDSILRNLENALDALSESNQMLSTGKRISRPHDDPTSIRKVLGLESTLQQIGQYERNIDQGLSWLQTTSSAVGQVVDALQQVRELAVKGANGTFDQEDLDKIKDQVHQLYEHILSLSETKYDNKYIFSGTEVMTKPYDPAGVYQGNTDSIQYEIGQGVKVGVNIIGQDLFDSIFNAISNLENHLSAPADQAAISADLGELDLALESALKVHSEVGSRTQRFELAKNRMADEELNIRSLLSETEDADVAKVLMELKMQESVYRASLGSAARIIQPTLLDFLR